MKNWSRLCLFLRLSRWTGFTMCIDLTPRRYRLLSCLHLCVGRPLRPCMYVVCEFDQRLPMVVLLWCRFVLTGVSAVSLLAHVRAEVHDLAYGR